MPETESGPGVEKQQTISTPVQVIKTGPGVSAGAAGATSSTMRTVYLPQLDGLRALAIVMVFVHHTYAVPLLWSGVDLFFILSGFLITYILLRDSGRMSFGQMLGNFYLRRAQRILPAYALCLGLIALLGHENWHRLWPFYAFFLQNLPYAFRMIGWSPLLPLWSLAVEQHFYLVWPFLVFFLPRRWLAPCMIGILVCLPMSRAVCTPLFAISEPIYVLTPFRIDAMAAGALAALVLPVCQAAAAKRWALVAMAVGITAYAFFSPHLWFRRDANTAVFNGLAYSLNILILGGLFVCVTLASPQGWLVRLLSLKPLRELDRVSYSFYLLHLLVFMRVGPYFAPRLAPLGTFVVTLLLAILSWKLIEKPILSLGGHHRGAALKSRST